jgi:hypothetical protein
LAKRIVANAAECWRMAVANQMNLFNSEMVVLGGLAVRDGGGIIDIKVYPPANGTLALSARLQTVPSERFLFRSARIRPSFVRYNSQS